jgi:peptidylamidoglycolate lyase
MHTRASAAFLLCAAVAVGQNSARSTGAGKYRVVHGWPVLPEGFALGRVSGVAVDSHNHVFVFHRGDRPILCFDAATGKILQSWGDGMFAVAHGLRVDNHDNVWVTDVKHHQVYKFSHDGELLMTLGAKDVPGLDGRHFNAPTDIAISPTGEFYVADGYGNNRIAKFSPQGDFLMDWGKKGDQPGEFDLPHGVALDAGGNVYVADRSNSRVQVFDSNGIFRSQWKSRELGRPWSLSIGSDGLVYVVDGGDLNPNPPDRARVVILDRSGKILEEFGTFGHYDGQFCWAHDVAVSKTGEVYVGDVYLGMRIQKFVRR